MVHTIRRWSFGYRLTKRIHFSWFTIITCLLFVATDAHSRPEPTLLRISPPIGVPADIIINGVVNDAKTNAPLPGVNVTIKGTTRGASTDAQGKYRIVVAQPTDILVFSFIGYLNKEETVGNRTEIIVTMADDQKQLDEVVVTALGVKREERALGYAVQRVSGATLQTVKGVNAATSLTGRVAGLWAVSYTHLTLPTKA